MPVVQGRGTRGLYVSGRFGGGPSTNANEQPGNKTRTPINIVRWNIGARAPPLGCRVLGTITQGTTRVPAYSPGGGELPRCLGSNGCCIQQVTRPNGSLRIGAGRILPTRGSKVKGKIVCNSLFFHVPPPAATAVVGVLGRLQARSPASGKVWGRLIIPRPLGRGR